MKAWLKEFGKSVLQKVLILGGIAAVVAVIVVIGTRPRLSASILDTVTLENGHFSVDGLHEGMTPEEVKAVLDAQNLLYFEGDGQVHPEGTPNAEKYNTQDTTWIGVSDETRVTELGRVTVRRTYYFRDGKLSYVDLKTDDAIGKVADDIERTEALLDVLDDAFGDHSGGDLADIQDIPGERIFSWVGEDGSKLRVLARLWQVEDTLVSVHRRNDSPDAAYTDYYVVVVRVML